MCCITVFLCHVFRGVWGGLLRTYEAPGKTRHPSGSKDPEGRIHRKAEERLPGRGFNNGPVRPPQCHPFRGGSNPQYAPSTTIYHCEKNRSFSKLFAFRHRCGKTCINPELLIPLYLQLWHRNYREGGLPEMLWQHTCRQHYQL